MRYRTLIAFSMLFASIGAPDAVAQSVTLESVSALQQQIAVLRRELRDLKGEVERAGHGVGHLESSVAKLVKDVDLRLRVLETRALAATPGTGSATAPALAGAAGSAPPAAASTPKTLGVLSKTDYDKAREGRTSGPAPSLPAVTAPAAVAPAPSSDERLPEGYPVDAGPKEQYDFAINLLYKRQLPEAETAMAAFLARHPKHDLASNAVFWIAETHYVRKDYKNAIKSYYEAYKAYPRGRKAPDTLLKLAFALGKLREKKSACSALAELESSHGDAEERILKQAAKQKTQLGCV